MGGAQFRVGGAVFTVGGAEFTVGGAEFTVGGAPKQGGWDPLNGTGDDFLGGHSYYFLSVSNYLSEKKRDLKSVSQCPFNIFFFFAT